MNTVSRVEKKKKRREEKRENRLWSSHSSLKHPSSTQPSYCSAWGIKVVHLILDLISIVATGGYRRNKLRGIGHVGSGKHTVSLGPSPNLQ